MGGEIQGTAGVHSGSSWNLWPQYGRLQQLLACRTGEGNAKHTAVPAPFSSSENSRVTWGAGSSAAHMYESRRLMNVVSACTWLGPDPRLQWKFQLA
jgi:hypothetical protein